MFGRTCEMYISNNLPQRQIYNNQKHKGLNFKSFHKTLTRDVLEIKGKETCAKIFTNNVEYKALNQIKEICNHPVFRDAPIRIMPDVHPSKNTVVGFSAPIVNGAVIPAIIGSDIGCGMLCLRFDTQGQEIDYEKLDNVISDFFSYNRPRVPQSLKKVPKDLTRKLNDICQDLYKTNGDYQVSRLASVGSGNHFIEIDKDLKGNHYLIVHTGSRGLGKKFAEHHQFIARHQNHYFIKELSYLSGDEAQKYLNDMRVIQQYAEINRQCIAEEILYRMGWKKVDSFESVHNYISSDGMIRKGAIEAKNGQPLIIPLNMRDGAILAKGKGNADWNSTAPHGAGRKIPRGEASQILSFDEFKDSMRGIHSKSVREATLDEAPAVYKDSKEIISNIEDTAEIQEIIKPIFNYKE